VARECERRQRVEREHRDLEHLRSGRGPAASYKPGLIGDSDHAGSSALGDVIDPDEACHLDPCADLFEAFTSRRVPRVLIVVDESARKAPQAEARFDRPAAKEYPSVDLDHHRGRYLGVVPQNEVVVGTGLDLAAFDHARHELGAAIDAVVGHLSNSTDH